MQNPEILSEKTLLKSPIFTIIERQLRLQTGQIITRQIVKKTKNSVLMVIQDVDTNKVFVQDEYRAGIDAITTGFPAGMIDAGENIYQATTREVREETGYIVNEQQITVLDEGALSEGFCDEVTTAVLIRVNANTPKGAQEFDDGEYVNNGQFVDLDEAMDNLTSISAVMAVHAIKNLK